MSKLTIAIGVTTAAMKRGLAGAKTKLRAWGKGVASIGSRATAALGTAMAAGVVFATGKIVNAADAIAKSSQRIGFTAEAYQKLAFAIRRSGGQTADAEKSVKRMQSSVDDLANGLSTAVRAFAALGLTYDDLKGKSPEAQFALIVERLNSITDAGQKSALAQDVFGRSGVALIPMLATYKELAQEAEDLGGIISNETVKASEELKDAIENLKASMTTIVSESGVIGWLADVAKGASDAAKALRMMDDGGMLKGETIEIAAPTAAELETAAKQAADGGIDHNQGIGLSTFVPIDAKNRTGATIGAELAGPTAEDIKKGREAKTAAAEKAASKAPAAIADLADSDFASANPLGDFFSGIRAKFGTLMGESADRTATAQKEAADKKDLDALREKAAAVANSINGAGPGGGGIIASSLARIGGERGAVVQPQVKAAQQQFRELQEINAAIKNHGDKLDALVAVAEAGVDKIDMTSRFS